MLVSFFIGFVWLLFAILCVFIFLNRNNKIKKNNLILIRKIWVIIYILGALIYWTSNPTSIFTEWKNYLIVAIIFLLVDAFIFLGLYLKKAGNYELGTISEALTEFSRKVEDYREKVANIHKILLSDSITGYYDNEESYFKDLKKSIETYTSSEKLTLEFFFYHDFNEKQLLKERYFKYDFLEIESYILDKETYYSKDSKLVLFPVEFQNKRLVIEIRSVNPITEVDVLLIDILLNMYVLGTELDDGGDSNGESIS